MGAESPGERANGVHHHLNPLARQAVAIALVKQRNDLVFEYIVERFGVAFIVRFDVYVARSLADGKAVAAVVGFGPPAIENGAVQTAVQDHLFATRAGSFERTARI